MGFGFVVQFSIHEGGHGKEMVASQLSSDADRLAETILGASGIGWYTSPACTNGRPEATSMRGDQVQRLGLSPEPCASRNGGRSFNLSFEKLQNLGSASIIADPSNGLVDYPEARTSLQLGDYNFHLRTWPVLPDVSELLETGHRDPNERVAYIGAYQTLGGTPGAYVVQKACGSTENAGSVDVWVDITNNGTTPAAFEVSFQVPLHDRTVEIVRHTAVLAPVPIAQRVSVTLVKTSDWQWAGTPDVTVFVSDNVRSLGSCTSSLSGITMTAGSTNKLLFVHGEKLENLLSGGSVAPKVYYDAYDGKGSGASYSDWKLEVANGLGVVVGSDTNLNNRGWETFTLVGADTYSANLKTSAGVLLGSDPLNVVSSALTPFTPGLPISGYDPKDPVVSEAAYVGALVTNFSPRVFNVAYNSLEVQYAAGGDIFPDLRNVLNSDLAGLLIDNKGTSSPNDDVPTLANYNILVVGSEVDHNAMTSAAAKQTIRDWVYAGGFLIVFGSQQQAVQWLEPIFHSALQSASGPLLTPDSSNPILHTPNELDYASYDNQGRTWSYTRQQDADHFSHIVKSGGGDILGVSDSGEFGSGRVLLTSYLPYNLQGTGSTGPCDPAALQPSCPSLQVLHNFLTYGYRDLYLDYGPSLPSNLPVAAAQRLATVYHPTLAQSIEVVVFLYVF